MATPSIDAAKAIADKAERILAKLKDGDRKAADKRRQAAAMLTIAAQIDPARGARAAELGKIVAGDADREAAAAEVHSLATRRQQSGSTQGIHAGKPQALKSGWIKGGDDFGLPIQPDRLREAIALFDIALSLHDESFWAYTKGLVQERLGDYAGAVHTFEHIRGHYVQFSGEHLKRCQAKLAGSHDRKAALDAAFGSIVSHIGKSGHQHAPLAAQAVNTLREMIGDRDDDAEDEDDGVDAPEADAEPDLAALIAQTFAELLVDGDFRAARSMLAKDLKHLEAADLEREYREMIGQYGEEGDALPDDLEVCVMSSETGMPEMEVADLGWVYVAINGDGFSEAVTVTVTREQGEMKIRTLEWGRP